MIEFFLAFIFILIVVTGMAVGVLNGRAPIAGTCGGLNNMGDGGACELCGGDMSKCDSVEATSEAEISATGRFYDADQRS